VRGGRCWRYDATADRADPSRLAEPATDHESRRRRQSRHQIGGAHWKCAMLAGRRRRLRPRGGFSSATPCSHRINGVASCSACPIPDGLDRPSAQKETHLHVADRVGAELDVGVAGHARRAAAGGRPGALNVERNTASRNRKVPGSSTTSHSPQTIPKPPRVSAGRLALKPWLDPLGWVVPNSSVHPRKQPAAVSAGRPKV